LEHRFDHSAFYPVLKTPMHRLIGTIARWQILPGSTRAQNPQNPIETYLLVAPRTAATIGSYSIARDELLDPFPLFFGQVHP